MEDIPEPGNWSCFMINARTASKSRACGERNFITEHYNECVENVKNHSTHSFVMLLVNDKNEIVDSYPEDLNTVKNWLDLG